MQMTVPYLICSIFMWVAPDALLFQLWKTLRDLTVQETRGSYGSYVHPLYSVKLK